MEHLTICTNMDVGAPTQYANFNFKSFTNFQGQQIAAGDDGIFLLNTGDTDNNQQINAWFETPITDLGETKAKHLQRAMLRLETNGQLELTITTDEGRIDIYQVVKALQSITSRGTSVVLASKAIGTHFEFRIDNIDGADFAIDSLHVLQILLSRYEQSRNIRSAGGIKIILSADGEVNG